MYSTHYIAQITNNYTTIIQQIARKWLCLAVFGFCYVYISGTFSGHSSNALDRFVFTILVQLFYNFRGNGYFARVLNGIAFTFLVQFGYNWDGVIRIVIQAMASIRMVEYEHFMN